MNQSVRIIRQRFSIEEASVLKFFAIQKALEEEILVLNKKLESEKDANDYLTRENFDRL